MATVTSTIRTISRQTQEVFSELIKLVLRRSIRTPHANPLGTSLRPPGGINRLADNPVFMYTYSMTHDTLGWTGDSYVNMRVRPRYAKNANTSVTRNWRRPTSRSTCSNVITDTPVPLNDRCCQTGCYVKNSPSNQKVCCCAPTRTLVNIITNRDPTPTVAYITELSYIDTFKPLESIGREILDQTATGINDRYSTAPLRNRLSILEDSLASLGEENPNIYTALITMVLLINSQPRVNMMLVISLIALLSYQDWSDLSEQQQNLYIDRLGQSFIDDFNNNELITILLQSDGSELILTASYLYTLLKMLYTVFGYSDNLNQLRLNSFTSGQTATGLTVPIPPNGRSRTADTQRNAQVNAQTQRRSQTECSDRNGMSCRGVLGCKVQTIQAFDEMYPLFTNLMGGLATPPPTQNCEEIPNNYNELADLPEFLWRFNEYSFCQYQDFQASRQFTNAVGVGNVPALVNTKIRFLNTL